MNWESGRLSEFINARNSLRSRVFSNFEWDIDHLLVNETLLPCVMVSNQKECAFMNNETRIKDINDILAGEKLKLPTWLARELQHRGFIEINTPDFLSSKMSNALKTDPYSIDLNVVTPYFFQISVILSNIFQDDSFLGILLESFRNRLEKLYLITLCLQTPNSIGYSKLNNDHTRAFLKSLTCIEKKILENSSIRYLQCYNSYFCKRKVLE